MQELSSDNQGKLFLFRHFLLGGISLLIGAVIYFLFRKSQLQFFDDIGLTKIGWLSKAREYCLGHSSDMPQWIIDSLPDGLWAFGYAVIITGVWSQTDSYLKYIWLGIVPVVVLGFEILQYVGLMPGTFCMDDILLSLLGVILGFIVGRSIS